MIVETGGAALPLGTTVFIVYKDSYSGKVKLCVETISKRTISLFESEHTYTSCAGVVSDSYSGSSHKFMDSDVVDMDGAYSFSRVDPDGITAFINYANAVDTFDKLKKAGGSDE